MPDLEVDIGSACSASNLTLHLEETDTSGNHSLYRAHGSYPAGSVVTVNWSNVLCSGLTAPQHLFFNIGNDSGPFSPNIFMGCGNGPSGVTATNPAASNTLVFDLGCSLNTGTADMLGFSFSASPCGTPCQYGTRSQFGVDAVTIITSTLLTSWLGGLSAEWLYPALIPLIGFQLVTDSVCRAPPPIEAPPDFSTFNAGFQTLLNYLYIIAWPHLCECVPGTPSPNPPPPPVWPQPPGTNPQPSFPCDPNNICATLIAIQQVLLNLQTTLGENLGLTTFLQRYNLPFATIRGATHGPLTGQGTFAIDRLVGLGVEVLQHSDSSHVIPDVPPYVWDLGWMSASDGGAMLIERRIARDSFQWVAPGMPLATLAGYSLKPGAVVNIYELEAEP